MRRPIVAVIGNNRPSEHACAIAEQLGRLLVERGFRLVTGGLGGVMEAASRGAHAAASYREGDVVGIVPSGDKSTANTWIDVVVPTDMGVARNVLVVSTADAVIALGGGAGTLAEIAIAWQLGRPIVAVEVGGWSGKLARQAIDATRSDVVVPARDAVDAVEQVVRLLQVP